MLSGIAFRAGPAVDVGRLEHVSHSPATPGAKACAAAGGAFTPWPKVGPMAGLVSGSTLVGNLKARGSG
jgi:hypothetical protein